MRERIERAASYCTRFDVAFDIGAHCGAYAIEMSRYFLIVNAYEPASSNFRDLSHNVQHKPGRIIIQNVAVSDRTGEAILDLTGKSNGYSLSPVSTARGEVVKTIALDDFPAMMPAFMKIDVEGHEYQVLRGAEKIIRKSKPVIMIEEKFDPELSARAWLEGIGYCEVWRKKHDRVFICKS